MREAQMGTRSKLSSPGNEPKWSSRKGRSCNVPGAYGKHKDGPRLKAEQAEADKARQGSLVRLKRERAERERIRRAARKAVAA